eukprot:CAMPEP_0185588538 /NCGR_PEP_ID=MMETSP0434-20130131/53529_1 /TAXON_ID=626734 ORGANISM="Favella taraikaensis, Strain Fe Narragansett Bay" /NCGR_SAMPLE_ID=MMETSP0434 /ASSEMBLY_ACC=CAM_ASM_000379 /LENGTH=72 /DNA_ID=CAMNT_0028211293 /DNA_START=671 /DNA_END=889 /DNA_ORIENTATION=+
MGNRLSISDEQSVIAGVEETRGVTPLDNGFLKSIYDDYLKDGNVVVNVPSHIESTFRDEVDTAKRQNEDIIR